MSLSLAKRQIMLGITLAAAIGGSTAISDEAPDTTNMILLAPVASPEQGEYSEHLSCTPEDGCEYCPSTSTYFLCVTVDTPDRFSRPAANLITAPDQNNGASFHRRYVP